MFITVSGFIFIHHYLDDFFGGHPSEFVARAQCNFVVNTFALLGIPTQWKKVKFPSTQQKILGWLYDTVAQTVSVPPDKARRYRDMCTCLIQNKSHGTDKKSLEHVKGCLQWAAPAVFPGKIRLRNLEHAMHLDTTN